MSAHQLITDHLDLWTQAVTQKSTAGRGGASGKNGKIELTGIKKLRELILELAVRGKLVEQDANDEPASVLLEKISAEKNKRIERGKINKPKKHPAIDDAELSFQIPVSWKFIRLGDAVDIIRGITFPASEKSNSPAAGRLACLRTTNVQGTIEVHDLLYIKDSFVTKSSQYIQKNDIVMSMANSRELVGKVAFVEKQPEEPMTFGGFLGVLRPTLIHPKFLMAVLRAPHSRKTLIGNASQTTNIANISIGKLNPLVISLPPLEEQHRIVQKVDELMALCDRLEQHTSDQLDAHETLVDTILGCLLNPAEGSFTQSDNATELADNWARLAEHFDTLFTTEQSIDKLKQAILQLAVMGRLVEQDAEDESASDLIQRINQERLKLEGEGKVRAVKKTARVSVVEPLPGEWAKCSLGTCISLISGQHLKGDEYFDEKRPESVPYLTGPAEFGAQTPEPQRYTFERRAVAEKGDILITCKGSGVGKLNTASEEIAISRQLMAARPILINARFLYLLLDSLRDAIREKTVGIAIPGISRGDILEANIQLPPLEEQHRIVQKIDELMALCDHLKQRLTQASDTRCQLAGAVVEGALN